MTDMCAICNATWGELMYRMKDYVEGPSSSNVLCQMSPLRPRRPATTLDASGSLRKRSPHWRIRVSAREVDMKL